MPLPRPGAKGPDLEEALKTYFWRAGYFVVRGVPFRLEGEDVTDIDLWLYERPGALTRRRLIVDIKNRKSPKVSERIIWTRGLQAALGIDGAIVATTDNRPAARRLAKELNITLLDGDAVAKITNSEQLKRVDQIRLEELDQAVKRIDQSRRSSEWRETFQAARSSLLSGMGAQATNTNLASSAFFAEQTILAQPCSEQAQIGLRLFYFTSALAAISLDYLLADEAFRSQEDRRQSIVGSIRFGRSQTKEPLPVIQAAIALARKYADNGSAAARQIEHGFYSDAEQIPAEIIAEYVSRISSSDALFNVAREIEWAALCTPMRAYDEMSKDAKSLLGVFLDFNRLSREKVAIAWPPRAGGASAKLGLPYASGDSGPLFTETESREEAKPSAAKSDRTQ